MAFETPCLRVLMKFRFLVMNYLLGKIYLSCYLYLTHGKVLPCPVSGHWYNTTYQNFKDPAS